MGQNNYRENQAGSEVRTVASVRLDSWKEIAAYLHRDARTVRRWERERRLPVHRVPGGERSGVFAYMDELDRWLRAKDTLPVAQTPADSEGTPKSGIFDAGSSTTLSPVEPSVESPPFATSSTRTEESTATERMGAAGTSHGESELKIAATIFPILPMPKAPPLFLTERGKASSTALFAVPSPERLPSTHAKASSSSTDQFDTAVLQASPSRWTFYGMAVLLIAAVIGASSFAYMHYLRFHVSHREVSRSSAEAQDLYLRGRYYWNLRTEDGLNQALDLFTQAIVNDPHYAPAYAGLADSYLLLRQYGHMPDAQAYPRALAAARQAIVLDPSLPDAHRSTAFILRFWNWDMPAAEREYLRAIELDPKNSQSHHWYATALFSSGRVKEALDQIDLARSLEPQSLSVLADRGLILSAQDQRRGAETLKQLALSQPEFVFTHVYLARVYLDLGEYAGFLSESRAAATLAHEPAKIAILDQGMKDLKVRGPSTMLNNLTFSYAPLAENGQVPAYFAARLFGLSGDAAKAIHFLHLACDRRDPGFLSFESDEAFRRVRSTPEYLTLLARKDAMPIARLNRPKPF